MPTSFADLQTLVYQETRRPELVDLTKSAIKLATLRAHHSEMFPRDGATLVYDYVPSSTNPLVIIPDQFAITTRLRLVKFIQSLDPVSLLPTENFENRSPSDTHDADGIRRTSIWTEFGPQITLAPKVQSGKLRIYYFQNPLTTEVGYSSWIADLYPEDVAKWAATIVQFRNGNEQIAKASLQTNVMDFKQRLIESHMLPERH